MNRVSIVAWSFVWALPVLRLVAADNSQLLAEFRKTKPEVSQVHVISQSPLLVAATGETGWARGELLGVFVRRGEQILPISIVPNQDYPTRIRIDQESADSITFGLSDPDVRVRSDNLKIFFDPKTYLPKRIVRFAPVHVRRVALVSGILTVYGSDGKQDFTASERNGVWHITAAPAPSAPAPRPVTMPFNPEKAKQFPQVADEKIGPYEKVGTKIWVGKTFTETNSVGVGDIGYFDTTTQDWVFLHVPEMAEWSASALLVEPDAVWVGLVRIREDANLPGGLLRYDRMSHKVTKIPLSDQIEKIIRVGRHIYCGTSGGFAVIEDDHAKRYEFTPQLDGSYTITPVALE